MDTRDLFHRIEAKYGLPSGVLDAFWAVESRRGKLMRNRATGAAGHFQFLPKTAERYGLDDPFDLAKSADAAARMASENAAKLTKHKLPVNLQNLYLLHQQGPSGGLALLSNPHADAASVLAPFYKNPGTARRAVILNGGSDGMSASDFVGHVSTYLSRQAGISAPSSATSAPAQQKLALTKPGFSVTDVLESIGKALRPDEANPAGSAKNSLVSALMKGLRR